MYEPKKVCIFVKKNNNMANIAVLEAKNDLHQLIVETNDSQVLQQVKAFFLALRGQKDWYNDISLEERKLVEKGLAQIQNGQKIPHTTVRTQIDARLGKTVN